MGGGHVFFPLRYCVVAVRIRKKISFLTRIKWFLCKTSPRLQGPYV